MEVEVYFGNELARLYEIGYITTDLYQLAALSDLIESDRGEKIDQFFGPKPAPINRFSNLTNKERTRSEIIHVREGSVELVVAVAGVTAAVLMPLVSIEVNRRLRRQGINVEFEISPSDQNLKRILAAYEDRVFGGGNDGLELLFAILRERGYNVTIAGPNQYRIQHAVNRYANRIVKTIKKNM